jgi:hypothetical protein
MAHRGVLVGKHDPLLICAPSAGFSVRAGMSHQSAISAGQQIGISGKHTSWRQSVG